MSIENCYNFLKINYNNSLFNETIDATYVLHLEGNGRYNQIINQLDEFPISQNVYIVIDKGYKKCSKGSKIKSPVADIFYTNIKIFEHAKINKYNNILLLEDDFIFNKEIKNNFHINNINKFLNSYKNKKFIYALGCTPFIQIPWDLYNSRIIGFIATHAIIFSKEIYNEIINDWYNNKINYQTDIYYPIKYYNCSFMYNLSLCYQIFPVTSNSNDWGRNFNDVSKNKSIISKILFLFIKLLKLDKKPEPGFKIIYLISKLFSLFIFIYIILLVDKYLELFKIM